MVVVVQKNRMAAALLVDELVDEAVDEAKYDLNDSL